MNLTVTQFDAQWRHNAVRFFLNNYNGWVVPFGILVAIVMFFIPLPTFLLSILIIVNLALSISILGTSLFISSPMQLTSYPTILLLTTVFRLSLSVSATRSILMTGSAGVVIESLGHVTAQGSVIVGFVMFTMILVVQFMVVGKGSERVSEVSARFTLDAMPGKQMAIDADLRAGLIPQEQARKARQTLQKESQLHGAMDGAMKFVKGDSIATVIIALVNLVAGMIVGVGMQGLPFSVALNKYTIMTFGDGLAAIISSMLITLSAGLVVTRISSDESESDVGRDIVDQLFSNPKPWYLTTGLLAVLGLIPGMPNILLLLGAIGTGGLAYGLTRKQRGLPVLRTNSNAKNGEPQSQQQQQSETGDKAAEQKLEPTFAVPLALVLSADLTNLAHAESPIGKLLRAEIPKLRSSIYYDLGVILPECFISLNAPLKPFHFFVGVKEVPVIIESIRPNKLYVNDWAENIAVFGLTGENMPNPIDRRPGAWIPMEQQQQALTSGLKVWQPHEVLLLHLSRVMRDYAHEFVGIQETQAYLDFTAKGLPKLVEEVVPKVVNIQLLTEVLRRMVKEGLSIRDTKSVLEALGTAGKVEKNPAQLVEHLRACLKRYVTFRYTGGSNTLYVYVLDPDIEDVIRGAIRHTAHDSFLALDPVIVQDIIASIQHEIRQRAANAQRLVIVTDVEVRPYLRQIAEHDLPQLVVLSYQELAPDLNIQPIGRISMRPQQLAK